MNLLTIQDVAARLQVSVATVRRLIAREDIVATRVSERLVRVAEEDLAAYLAGRRGCRRRRLRWVD